jgi:hypothetical protein
MKNLSKLMTVPVLGSVVRVFVVRAPNGVQAMQEEAWWEPVIVFGGIMIGHIFQWLYPISITSPPPPIPTLLEFAWRLLASFIAAAVSFAVVWELVRKRATKWWIRLAIALTEGYLFQGVINNILPWR